MQALGRFFGIHSKVSQTTHDTKPKIEDVHASSMQQNPLYKKQKEVVRTSIAGSSLHSQPPYALPAAADTVANPLATENTVFNEEEEGVLQYKKGVDCERQGNVIEAGNWYYSAASLGNVDATYALGRFYETGQGDEEQDAEAAFHCYARAAIKDHVAAMCALARCYENGIGCAVDKKEAFKCYKHCATKHHYGPAYYDLGRCYEQGIGVKCKAVKAIEAYAQAYQQYPSDALAEKKNVLVAAHRVQATLSPITVQGVLEIT